MSDINDKEGAVIDVTPEHEPQQGFSDDESSVTTATEKRRSSGSLPALLLAIVAIIGVLAAAGLGYRYWQGMVVDLQGMNNRIADAGRNQQALQQQLANAKLSVAEQKAALAEQKGALNDQKVLLAEQETAFAAAREAFKKQEQLLAGEKQQMQDREIELRAAVADVHKRVGSSSSQWMVAEAEYLIRIGNHRLSLARDVETARVALELADQRLRDTKDPGWNGVRSQLAVDIAKLSAFNAPDNIGISAKLSALVEQIPQLKLTRATIGAERTLPEKTAKRPRDQRSWDTLLNDLLDGFKNSVRIRRRDEPIQTMLAPEHQFFMYENLKLHIESTRLALARGDSDLFKDNLQTAYDWLGKYFERNDAVGQSIGNALAQLRSVNIAPPMPDISTSLRVLNNRKKLLTDLVPGEAR